MNQGTKPIPFPTERREFVRVQDAIGLEFVSVSDESDETEQTSEVKSTDTRVANKYDIEGYGDVKHDFPAVADYIATLEERIRHLRLGQEETPAVPTHRVSLSVSGIAFADKRVLQPGTVLKMTLTLFPSGNIVECSGTVLNVGVESELASGDLHTYRISFNDLGRENAAIIHEHVRELRRGMRQLAR